MAAAARIPGSGLRPAPTPAPKSGGEGPALVTAFSQEAAELKPRLVRVRPVAASGRRS